jgi:hypothetical protein
MSEITSGHEDPQNLLDSALDQNHLIPPAPGVFEIQNSLVTTLQSVDMPSNTRHGASKTDNEGLEDDSDLNSSVPSTMVDSELPMIVWLRGDEPWFIDFSLDADAVMSKLGIKRSRLTQISGKELRVGRVRVERYIKPVFRACDVESYLQWTRATASHQKSSTALKDAAQLLQVQGQQIAQVVSDASQHFSDALKTGLLKDLEEASTRSIESLAIETASLRDQLAKTSHAQREANQRSDELFKTQLNVQDMRLDALENVLSAAVLRLAEVADRQLKLAEQYELIFEKIQKIGSKTDEVLELNTQAQKIHKRFERKKTKTIKPIIVSSPQITLPRRPAKIKSRRVRTNA